MSLWSKNIEKETDLCTLFDNPDKEGEKSMNKKLVGMLAIMVSGMLVCEARGELVGDHISVPANGEVVDGSPTHVDLPKEHAFNGSTSDRWLPEQATIPGYVTWQFTNDNAYIVQSYRIMGQSHNTTERSPKDHQLYGSNDGTNWTVVHAVTNIATVPDYVWVTFTVDSPGFFEYYKFNVTEWGGSDTYGALREIELYGNDELWSPTETTNVTKNTAWATARANMNLDVAVLVWDTEDRGITSTNDWAYSSSLGSQNWGTVTEQMTSLAADSAYVWRFYGENTQTNGWSAATPFATTPGSAPQPLATGGSATNVVWDADGGNWWAQHVFTDDGTFTPLESLDVEYLIVGGGGGGGAGLRVGGGGGGAVITGAVTVVAATNITVGAGGGPGTNGFPSVAFTVTAGGGGAGGAGGAGIAGTDGSSGGGGGFHDQWSTSGGAGDPPGNDGGSSFRNTTTRGSGGGGGGAGGNGANASSNNGGDGGEGAEVWGNRYAGGGGGGSNAGSVSVEGSGQDGGGDGGVGGSGSGTEGGEDGTPNTGGGGGGAAGGGTGTPLPSGSGGSGIVIVRYALPPLPKGTLIIIN